MRRKMSGSFSMERFTTIVNLRNGWLNGDIDSARHQIQKSSCICMRKWENNVSTNCAECLPLPFGMVLARGYLLLETGLASNLFITSGMRDILYLDLNS